MKKPNLFIVGAPKSGTTSLYYYLKEHPEIFMCPHREPNYFCKDLTNEISSNIKNKSKLTQWFYKSDVKGLEEYINLFKDWKNEKIGCDPSSGRYLYSRVAAGEINKFNPKAKIIIMLREPTSFMRSLHSHLVSHLSEIIDDFEEALNAEADRKAGKRIGKGSRCPPLLYYSEVAKFSEQIERYLHNFGREKVKVVILDDLKDNPVKVYLDILKFIGVDTNFKPYFKHYNENKRLRWRWLKNLTAFPYIWKAIKEVIPDSLYIKIKGIILKTEPRNPISLELKLKLMKQFKSEVEKLSKLLNRDLVTLWGYDKI